MIEIIAEKIREIADYQRVSYVTRRDVDFVLSLLYSSRALRFVWKSQKRLEKASLECEEDPDFEPEAEESESDEEDPIFDVFPCFLSIRGRVAIDHIWFRSFGEFFSSRNDDLHDLYVEKVSDWSFDARYSECSIDTCCHTWRNLRIPTKGKPHEWYIQTGSGRLGASKCPGLLHHKKEWRKFLQWRRECRANPKQALKWMNVPYKEDVDVAP